MYIPLILSKFGWPILGRPGRDSLLQQSKKIQNTWKKPVYMWEQKGGLVMWLCQVIKVYTIMEEHFVFQTGHTVVVVVVGGGGVGFDVSIVRRAVEVWSASPRTWLHSPHAAKLTIDLFGNQSFASSQAKKWTCRGTAFLQVNFQFGHFIVFCISTRKFALLVICWALILHEEF